MITQSNDIPADKVDTKSLATLIIELNISRRNCRAYPKGHPVIAASLAKVLSIYENLLNNHEEIILGVSSDALMVDGVLLEKSNVVYRDFSRVLFERGIGALLFHRGLTIRELTNFTTILGLKREQIQQHGSIEKIWATARITAMAIRAIRYDLFQTMEESSVATSSTAESGEGLWDRFAKEVTRGELPPGSSSDTYLKMILREHASEEFVPDDYQTKLNHIIASEQIPRLNMEEVNDLLVTVENRSIENSVTQILINLVREGGESSKVRDLLLQNLCDMFGFFLETGDYGQLHAMLDQLTDGTFPVEIQYHLRDEYCRREFLDEILDGLTIWGKPRYDDIRSLIHKIGGQFVEAILDHLSEEKSMSLRRFYMDCLVEMGPVTRVPIVNRLNDKRWYFLRNLLIILSAQNDPSVAAQIRPLLRSDDPRLRHEVLKALVHFRDPQAEKKVLEDLESRDAELQSTAIQLAKRCTSPAIATKLASMVSQGGFSQIECERKSEIVRALGEIGHPGVLPELAKILRSRSLFKSRQLTKLKADIIRSLPKYPPNVSIPALEHIANGSDEIARLAVETIRIISGKRA